MGFSLTGNTKKNDNDKYVEVECSECGYKKWQRERYLDLDKPCNRLNINLKNRENNLLRLIGGFHQVKCVIVVEPLKMTYSYLIDGTNVSVVMRMIGIIMQH